MTVNCSECLKKINLRTAVKMVGSYMCRACHEELQDAYDKERQERYMDYLPDPKVLRENIASLHAARMLNPKAFRPSRVNGKRRTMIPGSNRRGVQIVEGE